jgi:hypothetical protein
MANRILTLVALALLSSCAGVVAPEAETHGEPCAVEAVSGIEVAAVEAPDMTCARMPATKGELRKVNPDSPKWCCP